jgi:hypothetical protein
MLALAIPTRWIDSADEEYMEIWSHEGHLQCSSSQWWWGRVWGAGLARIVGLQLGRGSECWSQTSLDSKHQHYITSIEYTCKASKNVIRSSSFT